MGTVVDFIRSYWAIIALFIAFVLLFLYNRQRAILLAKNLILEAEEKAEEYALKTGQEKFAWVSERGYNMLPMSVKLFISKPLFETIIQYTFDKLIDWAEVSTRRHKKV